MLSNYRRIDCIAVSVSSLLTMLALAGSTQAKAEPAITASILQGTDGDQIWIMTVVTGSREIIRCFLLARECVGQ